ncbi:hypothetical protein CPB85DRAFT_1330987 [Mucidula mucida]|nr:hypothetical protein CPB85DRAFT_1330987 [Mucidula mucida]
MNLRIMFSDMQDLVAPSRSSTQWMSLTEYNNRCDAIVDIVERCLEAGTVLSETVGGVARQWWNDILSNQRHHGMMYNHFLDLQALVILIMSSKGAWTDTFWWETCTLYIPSRGLCHHSFTSSAFEGRILVDLSRDRPWKDLADVMRITLPYFREMKARLDTLSINVGYSSDSASILGPSNLANLITCLDIAESVAKMVPVFGDVLEGVCGILRKTVEAAEKARAARDECRALAEHTASITLAILNEIGPASTLSGGEFKRICDLRDTIKIVDSRVQRLSKLGRLKYIVCRGIINAEVMRLRAQVDNARVAFNIRSDISTTRLLTDLRNMQIRLASRVENIYEGQKTTHHMLRTILVKVQSHSGGAYIVKAGRKGAETMGTGCGVCSHCEAFIENSSCT